MSIWKILKTRILKEKISITIITTLVIIILILLSQKQDYKYNLFYYYQAIPDIELKNTLFKTQGFLDGEVSGFVKFNNLSDQPKNIRQYYILKALNKFDENHSQYFSLEQIIKMSSLSPRSLEITELRIVSETIDKITLEDEGGNQFFIDKATRKISMRDATGDNALLITDDSDYKEFMKECLLE